MVFSPATREPFCAILERSTGLTPHSLEEQVHPPLISHIVDSGFLAEHTRPYRCVTGVGFCFCLYICLCLCLCDNPGQMWTVQDSFDTSFPAALFSFSVTKVGASRFVVH